MKLKSYTMKAFRDIGSMSQEEVNKYNQSVIWGIKPIDCIPLRIMICMLFDLLQLFIPRLRL